MSLSRPTRVLYVDDDVACLRSVQINLELQGRYELTILSDSREVLAEARTGLYDIVLTACVMPYLTGWEVIEAMDQDRKLRRLPVLMASPLLEGLDDSRSMCEVGGIPMVNKPFDFRALEIAIDRLVARASQTEDPTTVLFVN
ncbi:MAG: response regulator [Verrucomicrobiota bacterium]